MGTRQVQVLLCLVLVGIVLSIRPIEWGVLSDRPTGSITDTKGTVLVDSLFLVGGRDTLLVPYSLVEAYKIPLDTWATKASCPGLVHANAVAADQVNTMYLYSFGGTSPTPGSPRKSTWQYDYNADTWTSKESVPVAEANQAIAVTGSSFYMLRQQMHVYDSNLDVWTTKESAPVDHTAAVAAIVFPRLAVMGIWSPQDTVAHSYNILTGMWTTLSSIPSSATVGGSIALQSSLFAFGGQPNPGSSSFTTVHEFAANGWTTCDTMPYPKSRFSFGVYKSTIYIAGGTGPPFLMRGRVVGSGVEGDPILSGFDGRELKVDMLPGVEYTLLSSPELSLSVIASLLPHHPPEDNIAITSTRIAMFLPEGPVSLDVDVSEVRIVRGSVQPIACVEYTCAWPYNITVTSAPHEGVRLTTALYAVHVVPTTLAVVAARDGHITEYGPEHYLDVFVRPMTLAVKDMGHTGILSNTWDPKMTLADLSLYEVSAM